MKTSVSQPLKIMGAGPAGLAAAITLAHHDIQAIVPLYMKKREIAVPAFVVICKVWRTGHPNKIFWQNWNKGYNFFLWLGRRSQDPRQFLFNFFSYSPLRQIAFPLGLWDLRRRHKPLPY